MEGRRDRGMAGTGRQVAGVAVAVPGYHQLIRGEDIE